MGPALAAVAGPLEGMVAPIEGELSIGRAPSNRLVIEDPSVAERQCLIRKEGDELRIWDVEGGARTFVNGLPARGLALKHGDQIRIGTSLFRVVLDIGGVTPRSVCLEELAARSTVRLRREDAFGLEVPSASTPTPEDRTRRDLNALLKISAALSSIRGL